MTGTLLLRADAGDRMGTGHVMRCLALAQAWQDYGGHAVLVAAGLSPAMHDRVVRSGFAVEILAAAPGSPSDDKATAALAARFDARWVVVDGYQFSGDYQRNLRQAGCRVLVIDDFGHAGHYAADLILNQNLDADPSLYPKRETDTGLLMGLRYALLRREFSAYRDWQRPLPATGRKVLVTLGGSDPDNVTLKVIQALGQMEYEKVEIVAVGGSYRHRASLESCVKVCKARVDLRFEVANMPELMAWADLAVAAGGATSWERAFMGLPSIILVLADNQECVAKACHRHGLGINLGRSEEWSLTDLASLTTKLLDDSAQRHVMCERGREAVDDLGAGRVCLRLLGGQVLLRRATAADCRRLWEWANAPTTRAASFNMEPILWVDHQQWFAAKLDDVNCLLFIAENAEGTAIGQIRFDADGDRAVVSIGLDEAHRNHGIGTEIIRRATEAALRWQPLEGVVALVKSINAASRRAFEKAGYRPAGLCNVRGHAAEQLKFSRRKA